ncbi:hypothetical protein MAR_026606 [Mya arenaria]|uniref:Uncharacterized protein n=1 Tax=Mya arenaria TaxID=6604 RepID=A0ABY7EUN2_MYAAR|nr:hypothetical protein MAR_026606 [Mya arenaria]
MWLNTCNHYTWSNSDRERDANGYVYGIEPSPSVPEGNCDCGAGWLDENNQGKTLKERPVPLTVYTGTAPVKCMVYSRLCCSLVNPCKLTWQEGKDDCLHVLSSETAAGDEIGWKYDFAKGCILQISSPIMDASIFTKWWFSWTSNMKIDFRQPCEVCGFEPKRLCCDGTRFNAHYIDAWINVSYKTKQLGEIIGNDDDFEKVAAVLQILPDEVKPSFKRFNSNMSDLEKTAYAFVLKMLATTASVTSLLPARYCQDFDQVINDYNYSESAQNLRFNSGMTEMRKYAPELHNLFGESMLGNGNLIPDDIKLFLQYLSNRSVDKKPFHDQVHIIQRNMAVHTTSISQFEGKGIRKFTIDEENVNKKNADHDDDAHDFERCNKFFTKVNVSAPGTSTLFLWFCADHGY